MASVVAPLTISNGPALDEASGLLYLADTPRMVIDVFDLDVERGELGGRRRFLDVGDEQIWPDGMTIDSDGGLWTALGRSGSVRRYTPDGALDAVIDLPVSNPTSLTFGGDDVDVLFVTSSWTDISEQERREQPLAGAIFGCRPGVTGASSPRVTPLARWRAARCCAAPTRSCGRARRRLAPTAS